MPPVSDNRSIAWTKTGGKTHRVTITSDEPVSSLYWLAANSDISYAVAVNGYLSPAWAAQMQGAQQCANPSPTPLIGYGGLFHGLFGGLF